jgi:hypothetical protein
MRFYSHLSEDERDQIGVLRAAGRSIGWIARVLGEPKPRSPGSCGATRSPRAGILRFTPPEPTCRAGGVKRKRCFQATSRSVAWDANAHGIRSSIFALG